MFKKKRILCLFTAIALVFSLAGCGSSGDKSTSPSDANPTSSGGSTPVESGGPTGEITIWVWTSISDEIDAYVASHPDTKINQVVIDAGDYLTKLQTTVASGGALPDLVWGEISNRGQLFSMDVLDELTAAPYNLDLSRIDNSVLPTMTDENGTVVGLERNLTPSGLAYHRGLAEQYLGTSDPDEISAMLTDWDAFIELGKKVVVDSGGTVKMFSSLGDVYYIVNGQMDAVRLDGDTINRTAVTELFTEIAKFRDAGIIGKIEQWSPAWYASFGALDAIFSPMPSFGQDNWIKPNVSEGSADWALIVPPSGGFSWGGTCWGVTKGSQNKELAWDFAEFDAFGEGAVIRAKNGETPSAPEVLTPELLSYESPYFAGQKITEIYINDIVPTISTRKPTKYDFTDICAIEIVLSGMNIDYSMTPEQAAEAYFSEMQIQVPDLAVK